MPLWSRTVPPAWAPCVRTKYGWEHAETGELLVAFGDTSFAEPVGAATISKVKLNVKRNQYKTGDELVVTVTWTEEVTVTGTPRIGLLIDQTTRYADYTEDSVAGPTASHRFVYQIVAGDVATAGQFSFLEDAVLTGEYFIDLNSGTINDVATGVTASSLDLTAVLPVTTAIKVN